jgi:hypothetical protein
MGPNLRSTFSAAFNLAGNGHIRWDGERDRASGFRLGGSCPEALNTSCQQADPYASPGKLPHNGPATPAEAPVTATV